MLYASLYQMGPMVAGVNYHKRISVQMIYLIEQKKNSNRREMEFPEFVIDE